MCRRQQANMEIDQAAQINLATRYFFNPAAFAASFHLAVSMTR
jgi:hypothetical protein